jgi:deoxyadenosine/deoxycytidine kinase
MKQFVVLAGNIGAGKSTLVGLLAERFDFRPYYEPVAENPYLGDFYADMARWAFPSQIYFLMHRLRSHRALMDDASSVVQDRSVYEDAAVFARNLWMQGILSQRDWDCYRDLYETVVGLLPPPDLVVYLRSSVPTLRRHIAKRGRAVEAGITDAYLGGLNQLYDEWVADFRLAPVLTIPGDDVDFVDSAADREAVLATVAGRLRSSQGLLFA